MSDQVRRVLVQRILDGYYRPGDRLVELQIARELKTSQGPVREALRELEALRLVESESYRGTRVRALSEHEMEEGGQVRGVLEQAAAEWAAVRFKRNVTPLRAEMEATQKAADAGDVDAYAQHNMNFHRLIVEAAGNAVLLRVWDSLILEARTRIGLAQLDIDMKAAAETHFPIVEALERGDGKTAGRLLREHAEFFCFGEQVRQAARTKVGTDQATSIALARPASSHTLPAAEELTAVAPTRGYARSSSRNSPRHDSRG